MMSLAAVLAMALAHAAARAAEFLHGRPRSRVLSLSAGISVAFVFVHLLPELHRSQRLISESADPQAFTVGERHVFLVALIGLTIFYGLELLVQRGHHPASLRADGTSASTGMFWIHMVVFALYNALAGFVVVDRARNMPHDFVPFAFALVLHLLVIDVALRERHRGLYDRIGRWLLAAMPLLGWAVAQSTSVSPESMSVLLSLLAGAMILNVLKEELPPDRESRFWAFALGVVGYTAVAIA